jgi:hypothetical protein
MQKKAFMIENLLEIYADVELCFLLSDVREQTNSCHCLIKEQISQPSSFPDERK